MKNKKLVSMVVSLSLVGLIGVGSTMAYLSSKTTTITNTFTVGNEVAITLHETSIVDGQETAIGNNYVGMMPGANVVKDPTVVVLADSSETYVYMEVIGLDANALVGLKIDEIDSNWKKVVADDKLDGVYVYKTIVESDVADNHLNPLFNEIGLNSDITDNSFLISDITVRAAAIQSAGFANEVAATAEAVKLFTTK